jgi:transcriptional regulator with XRE-family HTH domain
MKDTDRIDPKVRVELRKWREKRNLTLREAAELAGISASFWAGLENDPENPKDAKAPGNATARVLEILTGIPSDRWFKRSERERVERLQRSARAYTGGEKGDAS